MWLSNVCTATRGWKGKPTGTEAIHSSFLSLSAVVTHEFPSAFSTMLFQLLFIKHSSVVKFQHRTERQPQKDPSTWRTKHVGRQKGSMGGGLDVGLTERQESGGYWICGSGDQRMFVSEFNQKSRTTRRLHSLQRFIISLPTDLYRYRFAIGI